jgi:hypothetical protein
MFSSPNFVKVKLEDTRLNCYKYFDLDYVKGKYVVLYLYLM